MKLTKNPIFWAVVALLGGMIIGGWGWDKETSTIPERTHGGVLMIVIGCVMVVVGLIIMFTQSNRPKQ
jgi:sugar phosphate permease